MTSRLIGPVALALLAVAPARAAESAQPRAPKDAQKTETPMAEQPKPGPAPLIVQRGELLLAGTRYAGDNSQGEIPAMWEKEFFPRFGELAPLVTEKEVFYGVGRALPGAMPGHFQYLAAAPVK